MKKAQIRMTETIAVLFIFFILILFGAIFFFKYQQISFDQTQDELLGKRAVDTTLRALFLPELQCSIGEAEPEGNCIDVMKLRHAVELVNREADSYYFDLFSHGKITVKEIYPGNEEWVVYDSPLVDSENVQSTFFVVSLRDDAALETKYGLGYVTVEVYS